MECVPSRCRRRIVQPTSSALFGVQRNACPESIWSANSQGCFGASSADWIQVGTLPMRISVALSERLEGRVLEIEGRHVVGRDKREATSAANAPELSA